MRELYTYEISTMQDNGRWRLSRVDSETSARSPESVARALLERWIIGNRGKITGGERIIVPHRDVIRAGTVAKVRVQVYRGRRHGGDQRSVAVAYLGHAESDYPALRSSGRPRRRLRAARQRPEEPEDLRPAGSPLRPIGDAA